MKCAIYERALHAYGSSRGNGKLGRYQFLSEKFCLEKRYRTMPMPKHLKRAGMGVFIDNYEFFATRPGRSKAIEHLMRVCGKNEGGASQSFGGASSLFKDSNLLREALEYIAYYSKEATATRKEKAIRLLKGL
jgi:hypothetical protein